MKATQWIAFGLAMLLVLEILVVPEAEAWGRRRRRWTRRRRVSRRRRSWFSGAVRSVGNAVRTVGRALHTAVVSKVGGYVLTGISLVNGAVGTACCTGGLLTGPPGVLCCGVTRGVAGATCAANGYRAQHFARNGQKLQAAAATAGAAGACFQAASGVTAGSVAWKAAKAAFAGRKKRSTQDPSQRLITIEQCGKSFLPRDITKFKLMTCALMDLTSHCKKLGTKTVLTLSRLVKNATASSIAQLNIMAMTYKNRAMLAALKATSCQETSLLPICQDSIASVNDFRRDQVAIGFDPATAACRHTIPKEPLTEPICRRRLATALTAHSKALFVLAEDIAMMYRKSKAGAAEAMLSSMEAAAKVTHKIGQTAQ